MHSDGFIVFYFTRLFAFILSCPVHLFHMLCQFGSCPLYSPSFKPHIIHRNCARQLSYVFFFPVCISNYPSTLFLFDAMYLHIPRLCFPSPETIKNNFSRIFSLFQIMMYVSITSFGFLSCFPLIPCTRVAVCIISWCVVWLAWLYLLIRHDVAGGMRF